MHAVNGHLSFGDGNLGFRQIGFFQRQPQNSAERRVLAGQKIQALVVACSEGAGTDLVGILRELLPFAIGIHQIMLELATVALLDRR